MAEQQPLFYTVEEVASMIRVDEQTIRNWIKSGDLRAIQVKRVYRIPADALEELLSSPIKTAALASSC